MNTQVQNILAQNTTKTAKIKQLILLGYTRTQIAGWVANGNYGFVQNVYARMKADGELNLVGLQNFNPLPFTRRFGVEFEAYNVDKQHLATKLFEAGILVTIEGYNHETRRHWKIVSDGSLTGSNTFELVSPVLEGEAGLAEVETVCQVLKACHAYINKSCGLHIHFDAQNFDLRQWKNIYKNYAGFEDAIDELLPRSRRGNTNTYCRSLRQISDLSGKIDRASSLAQIAAIFGASRYYKINPISYQRHNTIEFRQHSGTIEFDKVSNWVLLLHNLVEYSKNHLATEWGFEGLRKFNQDSVITYYQNRREELAA